MNPVSGKDNSLTGVGNDRPNVVSSTKYTGADHGLVYQYVNPNLYTANAIGTFGNASHASLRDEADAEAYVIRKRAGRRTTY